MAKKKGIGVNSVILIIVVVLVVGLSLGVFYKAPVESGEGELGAFKPGGGMPGGDEKEEILPSDEECIPKYGIFKNILNKRNIFCNGFENKKDCEEINNKLDEAYQDLEWCLLITGDLW